MEEVNFIIDTTKEGMNTSLSHLDAAFAKIRAGRANPAMLSGVMVEYYGAMTPLSQVANVGAPDGMTLSIQPWEKNIINDIERAIINSNLGFAPNNNGDSIIISIPPLTAERRVELAKMAKSEAENSKISVRNHRKDANQELKKIDGAAEDIIKSAEDTIQKLTDEYIVKIDEKFSIKEQEIMKI